MPEDGQGRPHPVRRLLLALARAAALFVLVAGIFAAITVALPETTLLSRAIASVLAGVFVYELLRRPRRAPAAVSTELAPDNTAELQEAQYALRQLRLQTETAKQREAELETSREQLRRDAENFKAAAARAAEEIQRIRTANDELRGQIVAQRTSTDEVRSQ